jgi:hypothetical protein
MLACHGSRPRGSRQTHEINTDGRDVALCVCVVGETEQQARLSDTRVSDEQELEEVVVSVAQAVSGGCEDVPDSARLSPLNGGTLQALELAYIQACADIVVPRPVAVGFAQRLRTTQDS